MHSKCLFLTFESAKNVLKPGDCPLWRGSSLWRDRKKVSTVQNREVSRFERFIYSKNCSGGPASVHNGEMSTLERCPHREVSL